MGYPQLIHLNKIGSGDEIHVVYIRPYLEPHSKDAAMAMEQKEMC